MNGEERGGRDIQQDDNDKGSASTVADNSNIDGDQKLHNTSSSSYEDNSEEWLMKRARKVFSDSAEDETDWLFKGYIDNILIQLFLSQFFFMLMLRNVIIHMLNLYQKSHLAEINIVTLF